MAVFYFQGRPLGLAYEQKIAILDRLQQLLSRDEPQVQAWAFIALAALPEEILGHLSRAGEVGPAPASPTKAWEIALRSISNPALVRAACLFLIRLLNLKALPEDTLQAGIASIALEVEMQGPHFPVDTACELLTIIMDASTRSFQLQHANVIDRIYNRMSNHWRLLPSSSAEIRVFKSKSQINPINVNRFLRLLKRMSGLPTYSPASVPPEPFRPRRQSWLHTTLALMQTRRQWDRV